MSTETEPIETRTGADIENGTTRRRSRRGDVAEGVISTAIAVLVIAFLGLLMWLGFRTMFNTASGKANETIEQIGR